MKRLYRIDENRICVSGFSAGAGLASQLVCGYPDVFRGGYFLMGGGFCVSA
jgi:poly(3-hydroxybutyrate) depolymerase